LENNPTKIDYYLGEDATEKAIFRVYILYAAVWQIACIGGSAVLIAAFDWSAMWAIVGAFLSLQMMGFARFKNLVEG
jgi:hypothetical protein